MPDRKYLTSRQVADLLGVSLGSVVNWERQQLLIAHRTAGGHRRFSPGEVRRYCLRSGLPIPDQLGASLGSGAAAKPVILVVHGDPQYRLRLLRLLPTSSGLDLRLCGTALGLGFELGHSKPAILVVDLVKPIVSWAGLVEIIGRLVPRPVLVGISDRGTPRPVPIDKVGAGSSVLLEDPADSEVADLLLDLLSSVQSDSSGPWAVVLP